MGYIRSKIISIEILEREIQEDRLLLKKILEIIKAHEEEDIICFDKQLAVSELSRKINDNLSILVQLKRQVVLSKVI